MRMDTHMPRPLNTIVRVMAASVLFGFVCPFIIANAFGILALVMQEWLPSNDSYKLVGRIAESVGRIFLLPLMLMRRIWPGSGNMHGLAQFALVALAWVVVGVFIGLAIVALRWLRQKGR